jgi:hypothetical protein
MSYYDFRGDHRRVWRRSKRVKTQFPLGVAHRIRFAAWAGIEKSGWTTSILAGDEAFDGVLSGRF